jgi:hypothetical protein
MQHISPLTFCALVLLDPALTAILSWLFGVEGLPMWSAWVGGGIVMLGVGLITVGEQRRQDSSSSAGNAAAASVPNSVTTTSSLQMPELELQQQDTQLNSKGTGSLFVSENDEQESRYDGSLDEFDQATDVEDLRKLSLQEVVGV